MPSYGYKTQIGWGEETIYGTFPTVTDFAEFVSESVVRESAFALSPGIRGDRRAHRIQERQLRRHSTAGTISMQALLEDQLKLWKWALGAGASVQNGATAAWTHTFTPADLLKSFGVEIERDARAFQYSGCKIQTLTFTCDTASDFCTLDIDVLGSGTQVNAASPTAATFSANQRLWIPEKAAFTINTVAAEIRRFTLVVANAFNDGDGAYGLGSQVRKRLDEVGRREVTGEIVMAFDSMAEVDKIAAETSSALVLTLTGALIETTFFEKLEVTLPAVRYDGNEPQIGGVGDEITLSLPYRALYNGTNNEVTVAITNRETAI